MCRYDSSANLTSEKLELCASTLNLMKSDRMKATKRYKLYVLTICCYESSFQEHIKVDDILYYQFVCHWYIMSPGDNLVSIRMDDHS